MKISGMTLALVLLVIVVITGVVFREEIPDFLDSMRPDKVEATITFGKGLDPSGQIVLNPTTTFNLGENVAWVVRFRKRAGAKELVVALFEISPEGREIPLDRKKMSVEPKDTGLYNYTTTQAFWSLSPKRMDTERHTYRVKYFKKRVIAQGDFTIIGDIKDRPNATTR